MDEYRFIKAGALPPTDTQEYRLLFSLPLSHGNFQLWVTKDSGELTRKDLRRLKEYLSATVTVIEETKACLFCGKTYKNKHKCVESLRVLRNKRY